MSFRWSVVLKGGLCRCLKKWNHIALRNTIEDKWWRFNFLPKLDVCLESAFVFYGTVQGPDFPVVGKKLCAKISYLTNIVISICQKFVFQVVWTRCCRPFRHPFLALGIRPGTLVGWVNHGNQIVGCRTACTRQPSGRFCHNGRFCSADWGIDGLKRNMRTPAHELETILIHRFFFFKKILCWVIPLVLSWADATRDDYEGDYRQNESIQLCNSVGPFYLFTVLLYYYESSSFGNVVILQQYHRYFATSTFDNIVIRHDSQ